MTDIALIRAAASRMAGAVVEIWIMVGSPEGDAPGAFPAV